jgi:hypothetical protein
MVNYQPVLIKMMSFLDEVEYEADKQFTLAELGELTPDRLMEWFNFMAFGVANPPHGHDMNPVLRSSTISYRKKAISSFMPNRLMTWNEISLVGNPTKSVKLNDLISYFSSISWSTITDSHIGNHGDMKSPGSSGRLSERPRGLVLDS